MKNTNELSNWNPLFFSIPGLLIRKSLDILNLLPIPLEELLEVRVRVEHVVRVVVPEHRRPEHDRLGLVWN